MNRAAAKIVGEGRTAQPQKTMGAEDFAYFLQAKPGELKVLGCFVFLRVVLGVRDRCIL